jgi:hypothetical protein
LDILQRQHQCHGADRRLEPLGGGDVAVAAGQLVGLLGAPQIGMVLLDAGRIRRPASSA